MINKVINFYELLATRIDKRLWLFEVIAFILFFIGIFNIDSDDFSQKKLGFLFVTYAIFIAVLGIFTYCFALKEQKLVDGNYIRASYIGNRAGTIMQLMYTIHFSFILSFLIFVFIKIIYMQQDG